MLNWFTGSRKTQSGNAEVKYCSDRCRHNKPGSVDRRIEDTFISLLEGEEPDLALSDARRTTLVSKLTRKVMKGDRRIQVACGTVEELVFGSRHDPEKVFGRKKNRAARTLAGNDREWKSIDMEDTNGIAEGSRDEPEELHVESQKNTLGSRIRLPQRASEVNGSVGGEKGWAECKTETVEEVEKRRAGQRRAEEREMVRRAARRACAFGLKVDLNREAASEGHSKSTSWKAKVTDTQDSDSHGSVLRGKCEAVMNGVVVEPSFAKGEWAIRWRE